MCVQVFTHFNIGLFYYFECREFLICSRYKFSVRYMLCKYILLVYSLSFYYPDGDLHETNVLNFKEFQFIIVFFYGMCFHVMLKSSLPNHILR